MWKRAILIQNVRKIKYKKKIGNVRMRKKRLQFIHRTFLTKLLLSLMVFSLLLFIPVTLGYYMISERSLERSITSTNQIILSQLKYNIEKEMESMKRVLMNLYLDPETQLILYQSDVDTVSSSAFLNTKIKMVQNSNPSIETVLLYNGIEDVPFSSALNGVEQYQQVKKFITAQDEIQPYVPLLHEITRVQGSLKINTYVFSYFIYDIDDNPKQDDSYIVINQNAQWLMENFAKIKEVDAIEGDILLLDDNSVVYGTDTNMVEAGQKLLKENEYFENEKSDNLEYFVCEVGGQKYCASIMKLNYQDTSLLLLRDYNEVFQELDLWRRNVLLVGSLFLIFAVIVLIGLSKRLYRPVEKLITRIGKKDQIVNHKDEFEYIFKQYDQTKNIKESLQKKLNKLNETRHERELGEYLNTNIEKKLLFEKLGENYWVIQHWNESFILLLIQTDGIYDNKFGYTQKDRSLFHFSMRNIFEELTSERNDVYCFYADYKTWGVIYLGNEKDIRIYIDQMQEYGQKYFGITLSVAIGDRCENMDQIKESYENTKLNLEYKYLFGGGQIIDSERCKMNQNNKQILDLHEWEDKFIRSFAEENGNCRVFLEDVKARLKTMQVQNVKAGIYTLLHMIHNQISERCKDNNESVLFQEDAFYEVADGNEYIDQVFQKLTDYLIQIQKHDDALDNVEQEEIGCIINYIYENYWDSGLSSQQIGMELQIPYRVLLNKFREKTGYSVNEYIMLVRLNKAANLLENTNMSIKTITSMIGIENETYFYKVFRKQYGCSPRKYADSKKDERENESNNE